MALNPLNHHYAMENPTSVYDEEAMTALELAGRTTGKVNEVVQAFNELEKNTQDHLAKQDKAIPGKVEDAVQDHIDNGEFDTQIESYSGAVRSQFSNEMENYMTRITGRVSSVETQVGNLVVLNNDTNGNSELMDLRTIGGTTYTSAGQAVRKEMDKKLPLDVIFTQVYIDGGVIREIEIDSSTKDILVNIDRSIIVRVYNTTSLAPTTFLEGLGSTYTGTTSTGKTAIRIPSSHSLILRKTSPISVAIVERGTADPLTTINLLENVSGYIVGGAFMHYINEYYINNNKTDLTKMKTVLKEQIYIPEGGKIVSVEIDGDNCLWFSFRYQLAGRVGVTFTHSYSDIGNAVGEEYYTQSPNGVLSFRIPSSHSFVFDRNATGYYRVIPREEYDPVNHFLLLDNVSGIIVRGALKWYFDKWENEAYARNAAESYAEVFSDNTFTTSVMEKRNKYTLSFLWASDTHTAIDQKYGNGADVLNRFKKLGNSCKVDFMTVTGDVMHGYWNIDSQKKNLGDVVNLLSGNTPVMLCMGNHDDNTWYADGTASNPEPSGLEQVLRPEKFYAMAINRNDAGVVVDPANPYGGWYYKDFPAVKIRAIFLNSNDMSYVTNEDGTVKYPGMRSFGYRESQLKWLTDTALSMPGSGWGIVFFEHADWTSTLEREYFINDTLMSQLLNAYKGGYNTTLSGIHPDFEVSYTTNFGTYKGELIAHFSGHTHKDAVYDDIMKHITIVAPHTETSGGCDLVTIDRGAKTIVTQRYSDKALPEFDRTINY